MSGVSFTRRVSAPKALAVADMNFFGSAMHALRQRKNE